MLLKTGFLSILFECSKCSYSSRNTNKYFTLHNTFFLHFFSVGEGLVTEDAYCIPYHICSFFNLEIESFLSSIFLCDIAEDRE